MSAQAGVFFFDSRPVDREIVRALGYALDAFGPDGGGSHLGQGLAMVQRTLRVAPEDRLDRQPVISIEHQHVLTWDGRLDNRDELSFQLWRRLRGGASDAALALAAYEMWGVDAFAKLVGDWSLVLWDARKGVLILASDYMGDRPLHYYASEKSVWWSSTLEALIEMHSLREELDLRFLVEQVTFAASPQLTPYRGIATVAPGTFTVIDATGRLSSFSFWQVPHHRIRLARLEDYEAELRRLFAEALRCRLRVAGTVAAHLSGGLDSSCIVCAADALIRRGDCAATGLETLSLFTDASPECDERRFMTPVINQTGCTAHYFQLDELFACEDKERGWVTPTHPASGQLATYRTMRDRGIRTVLTGLAGDTVMGNCLDYVFDVSGALSERKVLSALALARLRARASKRTILDVLLQASENLLPLPYAVRRGIGHALSLPNQRTEVTPQTVANVVLVTREFAEWLLEEWRKHFSEALSAGPVSYVRTLSELVLIKNGKHAQRPSDYPQIELTHPYLHRPLVEFMCSIPVDVAIPPGEPRGLMRRAFAPFVPDRVINRFSKGHAAPFYLRSLREHCAEWLARPETMRAIDLGCFDKDRVVKAVAAVRDNASRRSDVVGRLFLLERWLHVRDTGRRVVETTRKEVTPA